MARHVCGPQVRLWVDGDDMGKMCEGNALSAKIGYAAMGLEVEITPASDDEPIFLPRTASVD